ncbi:MAG TPA: c-type cytochrome biogenesis protein CcmI [Caulobacteraceae bacterium]|jgi:cytochrome c-type biogenesis protein CcmH|nr:c-type cytochrome biogenesis protein CcmI [Caulobacteraceae bacterium]
MLAFWIAAALLSAAAVMVVLARAGRAAPQAAEAPEVTVYRRHLDDLDAQRERGLLDDAGYDAARAEAARRLLAAKAAPEPPAAKSRDRRKDMTLVLGCAVVTVLAGVGVYLMVGSPGHPDQPYAKRLKAWDQIAGRDPGRLSQPELAAVWKQIARRNPRDPQAWRLLGQAYSDANDPADAAEAFEKAVALDPNSAIAWAGLGDSLTALNDGEVTADAQQDFAQALKLDPSLPGPAYYLGEVAIETGHKDEGLNAWRGVAARLPQGDPRRAALQQQIAAVAGGGNVNAATVANAPPPQQLDMIKGMVAGLAQRLAQHPDDPEGWARLVKSYGVLGDAKAQADALQKARKLFHDRPADLAKIEAAAH